MESNIKFKLGKRVLAALLLFLAGMLSIPFIPAPIKGTFAYYDDSEMMIGAPSFVVFRNGKAAHLNAADEGPAKVFGEYKSLGWGKVKITTYHLSEETDSPITIMVRSLVFSVHFPKLNDLDPPWGRRLFDRNKNLTWIRALDFVRFTKDSDSTPIKETYDFDLKLISTERNPADYREPGSAPELK
jgi:hypothetical protein